MMKKYCFCLLIWLTLLIAAQSNAQPTLLLPQSSQLAEVKQRIGYTDVTIVYHSPAVNGRKVWGALVPCDKVWRAGANENTTITFTDNVTINGSPLPAGTYGLHMIPGLSSWVVVFSKNHTSWGSYFYNKDEDALRVQVKPETHEHTEWLEYTFTDREAASANVALSWEKIRVSFSVGVDVHAIALDKIRLQLRGIAAFGWHAWEEAAHYCIVNKINYEEALKWVDRSILVEENHVNLAAKAQLLTLMGRTKEAADINRMVLSRMEAANETQVNSFGYELMNEHDVPTALEVFRLNVKKHPDSWNAYDSLAEALAVSGDRKQALANYKIALSKAPDDQKQRIKGTMATLEQ